MAAFRSNISGANLGDSKLSELFQDYVALSDLERSNPEKLTLARIAQARIKPYDFDWLPDFIKSIIWYNNSSANLSGANLSGANLSGASLTTTNLSGADLTDAKLHYARMPGGIIHD